MSVVFVVDSDKSALYTAACARTEVSGGSVVVANQFSSPNSLLIFLLKKKQKTIIFSWRQGLLDCTYSAKGQYLLKKIQERTAIGVLIPDHLGLEQRHWSKELTILGLCDYYMVTSNLLFEKYSQLVPEFPPISILHDLPNRLMIEHTRNNHLKLPHSELRVIWVGNSKWGERQGFHDHKGFQSVIRPLKILIDNCEDNISFEIIDSGVSRMSYELVLQKLHQADVLIQTSNSEGTGLPILEALGLETDVMTTNVGVASEIFSQDHESKFIDRNAENILIKLQKHSKPHPNVLRNLYLEYCQLAKSEKVPEVEIIAKNFSTRSPFNLGVKSKLTWYYRFLMK